GRSVGAQRPVAMLLAAVSGLGRVPACAAPGSEQEIVRLPCSVPGRGGGATGVQWATTGSGSGITRLVGSESEGVGLSPGTALLVGVTGTVGLRPAPARRRAGLTAGGP